MEILEMRDYVWSTANDLLWRSSQLCTFTFLRSNERKAWKFRDSKGTQTNNLCDAESTKRIMQREQKDRVLQKQENANLSSQLTLCSLSCYAVRKWSIMSFAYHSATSKQNNIQVTSWLASDKILSRIIIKWIHFTTVVWHVVFLVRHCTAIHD